jgi:hypothetical protein
MKDLVYSLRHYLATLAFRLRRVTEGAPDGFADFDVGSGVRSPLEILRHMSGLMYFTQHLLVSGEMPTLSELTWIEEVDRFRRALTDLDRTLMAMENPEKQAMLKALQGPLADAMTHIGQLATLRRLAGAPIEGISFARADIKVGVF